MALQELRTTLPEYAKDIKLNLGKVMEEDGVPGLNETQMKAIALASAFATKSDEVIRNIKAEVTDDLEKEYVYAAQAAVTVMAMNNVYYRFVHLVSDKEYSSMPANLRMNVIGNPGISKVDFELMCLAVSAINGCGMCLDAHANELTKHGVSKQGVQSAVRIASVLNAAAQALLVN